MKTADGVNLEAFVKRCEDAEGQIIELNKRIDTLTSGDVETLANKLGNKEVQALIAENKKLKYRVNIMKRSIEEMETSCGSCCGSKKSVASESRDQSLPKLAKDNSCSVINTHGEGHMVNILGQLEIFFATAIREAFPDLDKEPTVQLQISKVADYQCNAALALAKQLKKNPREVCQQILEKVGSSPVLSKVEPSGPGFINITLSKTFIQTQVANLTISGVTPPVVSPKKAVVDFSSPNIAKEMHVGHLRSTIIGDSICRLLEFLGHQVLRLNHLGDWGTQFGMLIAHLEDEHPQFETSPPPISDLQAFYKASKKRFDEDSEFKKKAYDAVVRLQSHEEKYIKAWKRICDISYQEFQKVYDRLDVKLEPRGESFYQARMERLVQELKDKNMLSHEEGRWVMYGEEGHIPLTVVKSDGGFTYDTSDLTCIRQRIEEEKADWLVYVTDAGQAQHFQSFLACAKKCGIHKPEEVRVDHVTFGVVLGEDKKKFKTRSGDTVRLIDLLEEGLEKADAILREKNRDGALSKDEFDKARSAVAYGCIKYADLSHDRTRDYVFSFERMLDFRGNTAAYLLYALTRIRSIARTGGVSRNDVIKYCQEKQLLLEHEKEWKLAKTLLKLPDVLVKVSNDLYLHTLCEYLYEVSTMFTEFYDNCYCIEKDSAGVIVKTNMHRLVLCETAAVVMEKCFSILGIETLDKM